MSVIVPFALLAGAVVLSRVLYVGSRMPETPWWAGDNWVGCVLAPAIVGMFALGGGFLAKAVMSWEAQVLGAAHAAAVVSILAVVVVLWHLLGRVPRAPEGATLPGPRPLGAVPTLGTDRSTPMSGADEPAPASRPTRKAV